MAAADSAAVVADDIRVWMLGDPLHDPGLLEKAVAEKIENVMLFEHIVQSEFWIFDIGIRRESVLGLDESRIIWRPPWKNVIVRDRCENGCKVLQCDIAFAKS